MKALPEISTPIIKELQDVNQEIRERCSSMRYVTEPGTIDYQKLLEEVQKTQDGLENISYIIYHHLELLKMKLQEHQQKDT